ncbi:MAG: MFS transporter [Gemmatimonadetes bacterium]|nr:MFS transporter [Gemmatimonadota bacterium]
MIWQDRKLRSKWSSITLLVICEAMALALWFSATAIIPVLRLEFAIDDTRASLFSSIVAVGYVAGTLGSAILGLADRLHPRHFFMASALVAAGANAAILLFEPTSSVVVVLRFVTGMCMAGLYPVGMKIASTWAKGDSGLLIGVLVSGLTLGAAVPHLFNAVGSLDWHFTLLVASAFAVTGGILINFVGLGPAYGKVPPFNPGAVLKAWTEKPIRLANFAYFGHLWELYAMWAWIALFLHASFAANLGYDDAVVELYANLATFAVVGVGAANCVFVGLFADRFGRTMITAGVMILSGTCALSVGFLFGSNIWLVMAVCLIWGASVVPDAPQTSACIIELSDRSYVGTMLTVQTCVGFMLTMIPIHLIPQMVDAFGWRYAFAPLAIGPFLGAIAMWRLRTQPDAIKLASGNL